MIEVHNVSRNNLPLCETLEVAGTPWIVATNSENVLRSLRAWKVPNTSVRRFSMRVLVNERLCRSKGTPVYRGMEHVVFATFGSDFFGFDLLRQEITAVICPETAQDEKFWRRVLIPIAIGVMGCFIGVAPLHSACLEWDGIGVLIAGVSGAGKSTLAAAMAKSGFSFLSDDWTYIVPRGEKLLACGLEIPFKLLPNAAQFFQELSDHPIRPAMNGELAYEIDTSYFATRSITSTVPRHLFMLERRSSGPPGFRRLAPEVVRDFFEQSSEPFPEILNHGGQFRSLVLDQVARLQCWRFTYSGSPYDAAAYIRRFLEQ